MIFFYIQKVTNKYIITWIIVNLILFIFSDKPKMKDIENNIISELTILGVVRWENFELEIQEFFITFNMSI